MTKTATIQPAEGCMEIGGKNYAVTACVTLPTGGRIPVVNIPQMSDEKWHELSRRSRHAG